MQITTTQLVGVCMFRVSLCLDHWYIKTWFSTRKARGEPDALDDVRYGAERLKGLKIARLRAIATSLHISIMGADGKNLTRKPLRLVIAQFLNTNPGAQYVSKRVKCVVDGEEMQGVVMSVSESVEGAGALIYSVKFQDDALRDFFLDEMILLE